MLVSKEIQFLDKAHTIMKEDKFRSKVLDRVRKYPWTKIIFNFFFIYVVNDDDFHLKNCLNKQTKKVDSLKINLENSRDPSMYT